MPGVCWCRMPGEVLVSQQGTNPKRGAREISIGELRKHGCTEVPQHHPRPAPAREGAGVASAADCMWRGAKRGWCLWLITSKDNFRTLNTLSCACAVPLNFIPSPPSSSSTILHPTLNTTTSLVLLLRGHRRLQARTTATLPYNEIGPWCSNIQLGSLTIRDRLFRPAALS